MRIAAVIRPEAANANYRARIPLLALREHGHDVSIFSAYDVAAAGSMDLFDVVHLCQLWEGPFQALARALKRAGAAVCWDSDVDLTGVRRGLTRRACARMARGQSTMLAVAHMVTVPSAPLAEAFTPRAMGEVTITGNYVAPPMVIQRTTPTPQGMFRVGWAASNEHFSEVESLGLRKRLAEMLDLYPRMELVTMGLDLRLGHSRYLHVPPTDLLAMPETIGTFDVGIAPLTDTEQNRARSDIKLKEYAAAGVPWVASRVGPYAEFGHEEGGKLINNEDWSRVLPQLMHNKSELSALTAAARAWGPDQDIRMHIEEWEEAFIRARARAAGD